MNKLQELLISGRCKRPTGQFWYGPEGTRKTGSAVSSKTLFLDLERGSDQYDCERIHITTYRDLIQSLDLIIHEESRHEIIVVDPIEIAEKLLIGETCRQLKIDGLQSLAHGAAWQYLRENFDIGLLTDCFHDQLAHQPGTIGNNNTNVLGHEFCSVFRSV